MIEGSGDRFVARPIQQIRGLGDLDRAFDLAEEVVQREELPIPLAEYDSDEGTYKVSSPLTNNVGYIVRPDLFHGFVEMRYQQLAVQSSDLRTSEVSLRQFLGIARNAISGNWEEVPQEENELFYGWLVKRKGGLYKPVRLTGSAWITKDLDNLAISWYMERSRGGRANG